MNNAASQLGKLRWANVSAEDRAEHSRMMNAKRWPNGKKAKKKRTPKKLLD